MGWNNPPVSWAEFERTLSARRSSPPRPWENLTGDSAPGWDRRHRPGGQRVERPQGPTVPYAELHVHSGFSFLDGASEPEALVTEAVRLGIETLALTDHDGFYGAARFAEAAREHDLQTVYGAELSIGLEGPQHGVADPHGNHLLLLADGVRGYHQLSGAITGGQLQGGEKGRPSYDLEELAGQGQGSWVVMTGCRKGLVRSALLHEGRRGAHRELDRLTALFGSDRVVVELLDSGLPDDSLVNDALVELAADHGLAVVVSGNVHYARPQEYRLASVLAAVRARRSLAEMDGWLPTPGAHLRSGAEMSRRFARYPGAVAATARLGRELAFDLQAASPRLPRLDIPADHTPMSWLRELTRRGADVHYAHRRAEAEVRLQRELAVIEEKDFPGYFIIVHDMVAFAREAGILCQGRGSAANSAVCYCLQITAVDAIGFDLPFERFLATTRDEEPDIDVDFDSDRREEVIQEVYRRYGRRNAAQVANVISYRPKSAVRDVAKALGYSTGQQDAWSKQIERWGELTADDGHEIPEPVVELASQLLKAPRHLGIHSGGMVLTERPVGEVVPIEHGRMEGRTVLQWDKDSCAWMGLVKFDLLGLGILSALNHTFELVSRWLGETWTLATLPKEERGVYDMLCRADTVGLFQVESRAQIGTLPRLQPREFYDLVIEIALIRPGPIQGGAVHPYIRRATGREEISYLHEALVPVLERTKGVPLFQEQLMQIAMTIGGCTGDDADLLRRAMGSKRGIEKIETLREQLFTGMAEHGITGPLAEEIFTKIQAFASFGFAESHAISFALLVYASAWLKLHVPAAYLAGLLRAQPMGFYSPQSLVADARRHGVETRRPDIARSDVQAGLEPVDPDSTPRPSGMDSCTEREQPPVGTFVRGTPDPTPTHRRDTALAVRLGLVGVQGIGTADAERIVAARSERAFSSVGDVIRRAGLSVAQAEALATAGAFDGLGISRRQALWNAGYADSTATLEGTAIDAAPPELPGMSDAELTVADLWATRVSPTDHPLLHLRPRLDELRIRTTASLGPADDRRRLRVAGLVTHRQRPGTASGITFLNLEDETGMLNVVCSVPLWARYRTVASRSAGLVIRGVVEHADGVTNLVADRLETLRTALPGTNGATPLVHQSRDFR